MQNIDQLIIPENNESLYKRALNFISRCLGTFDLNLEINLLETFKRYQKNWEAYSIGKVTTNPKLIKYNFHYIICREVSYLNQRNYGSDKKKLILGDVLKLESQTKIEYCEIALEQLKLNKSKAPCFYSHLRPPEESSKEPLIISDPVEEQNIETVSQKTIKEEVKANMPESNEDPFVNDLNHSLAIRYQDDPKDDYSGVKLNDLSTLLPHGYVSDIIMGRSDNINIRFRINDSKLF